MRPPPEQRPAVAVAVAGLAALGFAWLVQYRLLIVPCELCLLERWPWRAIVACGLLSLVVPSGFARAMLWVAVIVAAASAVLAGFHVGVEQQLWPSPFASCRAPGFVGGSLDAQLAALPDHASKPCDAPTDLIPALPVSMAAMNGIASVLVGGTVAMWLLRHRQRTETG